MNKISVGILDDHQSIIDGYLYRLSGTEDIDVIFTANYGNELEAKLHKNKADVLILDVSVPTGPKNPNPYPILNFIPKALNENPNLAILIISMHCERGLIASTIDAGARGYILKDDLISARNLSDIIKTVANGKKVFSKQANAMLNTRNKNQSVNELTSLQKELLSLIQSEPEITTTELSQRCGIKPINVRASLSAAYIRLGVYNRAQAIRKVHQMGLIAPDFPVIPTRRK